MVPALGLAWQAHCIIVDTPLGTARMHAFELVLRTLDRRLTADARAERLFETTSHSFTVIIHENYASESN